VRATTAFNRIIAIDGVVVQAVTFTPEGVVVTIRRRKRMHQCPCGFSTATHYDRSVRRWPPRPRGGQVFPRGRDLSGRLSPVPTRRPKMCPGPDRGLVTRRPSVRWSPGSQRVDETTITKLLRVSWEAVAKIVTDVV
jgi:transposase